MPGVGGGCGGVHDLTDGDTLYLGRGSNVLELGSSHDHTITEPADFDSNRPESGGDGGERPIEHASVPIAVADTEAAGQAHDPFGKAVAIFDVYQEAEHDTGALLFHADGHGPDIERSLGEQALLRVAEHLGGDIVEVGRQFNDLRCRCVRMGQCRSPFGGVTLMGMNPSIMIPAGRRFVKTVGQALTRHCGVKPGDRLMLAVSGGADSVALLRAMAFLATRANRRLTLVVGHVHHHMRPDVEADRDAAFVEALAHALGLPCCRADIEPAALAGNLEANARRLRYEALGRLASGADCSLVVTAHHADDQLETLLMRLGRGAGTRGMAGIAPRRRLGADTAIHLIRPMLALTRDEIRAFLDALEQPWCEDLTNRDPARLRNRLRHQVLPTLLEMCPASARHAAELADQYRDAEAVMRQAAKRQLRSAVVSRDVTELILDRAVLRSAPAPLRAATMRLALRHVGVAGHRIPARSVDPVCDAVAGMAGHRRQWTFAGQVRVTLTRDRVSIHIGKGTEHT